MHELRGKTVVVGVTGGIAAYKTCALVSKLVQSGAEVHVMMTKSATEFVAPLSFETLSHNRVIVDTFDRNFVYEVEHVALSKKANVVVIAPATANVIAKMACGIADDFLTTTVLACKCPIIFAPAMNTAMLNNTATKQNIDTLVSRGMKAVYGTDGYLACGDSGSGRMAEPEVLFEEVKCLFRADFDLSGKKVLVTAGGTRCDIDPVRFIANRSSGKMGYALALSAYRRGADIVFVKGHTDKFDLPSDWTVEEANTTDDMLEGVKKHYGGCDVCVMAAAPCDYAVTPANNKIKSETVVLELKKTTDIAAFVGKNKKGKLVIFAAETEKGEKNARAKLKAKNADLVVLNDVTVMGAGFYVDTNIVTLITENSCDKLPLMSKSDVADRIWDKVIEL